MLYSSLIVLQWVVAMISRDGVHHRLVLAGWRLARLLLGADELLSAATLSSTIIGGSEPPLTCLEPRGCVVHPVGIAVPAQAYVQPVYLPVTRTLHLLIIKCTEWHLGCHTVVARLGACCTPLEARFQPA